jgi:predicted RND superfamily exporter protein
VALLVIGLVHYHAFRTLQALFLPLLTGLLAVVWAVGLMGVIGVPLDLFNVSTPILILAVAAGHAVQILKRFYEEYEGSRDVRAAIVESLVRTGPVMLAAGTVAALAFCSLATFPMATIRTFGLFTGFGIISALAIELTIIPAVRALLPPPRAREREREAAAHPWIDAVLTAVGHTMRGRGPRWTLLAAGITLLVSGLLATRIEVDTSAKRQFADDTPVRRDDARLNAGFAGTNTLDLLVEGGADGALEEPALVAAVYRLERALEVEPGVGKAFSYADFLRVVHRALVADRSEATDLPGTRGLVAQELLLISEMGGVDEASLRLDPSHRIAVVRVLAHEDGARYGSQLIARARHLVATTFPPGYQVRYGGTLATSEALTEVMVEGKLRNIVQVAAVTFGITSLMLRSLIGGLLATIPLVLTVALNFAAMGLLGIPLDAATATISAISVGIGVDYAIYFLLRVKEEIASGAPFPVAIHRSLMTSGKAVVFVSSAIALGYATLCISGFGLHVQLGGLVALAMVTSAAGTLALLPALIARVRLTFLTPDRSA